MTWEQIYQGHGEGRVGMLQRECAVSAKGCQGLGVIVTVTPIAMLPWGDVL